MNDTPVHPSLYELIFKEILDNFLYTEDDNKYESMLLATKAHKYKHHSQMPIIKQQRIQVQIIASLMSITSQKQKKKWKRIISRNDIERQRDRRALTILTSW